MLPVVTIWDILETFIILMVPALWGLLVVRKSIVALPISIEIGLLAVSLTLIGGGVYWDDLEGQIMALFVLSVAGAESALGLAIMVGLYRLKGNIGLDSLEELKG